MLSNEKKAVFEIARRESIPDSPGEIIKDMVFESLGLKREDGIIPTS